MALLKLLCTFVVAILAIMSTGGSLGAVAARPVRLQGTGTEALLGERGGRRLVVSPWSTRRRDADKFGASKLPSHSDGSNSPGIHPHP